MPIKDSLLVKRSRAGKLGAFDELVKRYENKVYTLAYRYIGNHNDANDMARAAFIRAYQSLSTCGGNTGFATWLYKKNAPNRFPLCAFFGTLFLSPGHILWPGILS